MWRFYFLTGCKGTHVVNIFNAQEKGQDKSLSLNCFTTRGVVLSPDESLHEAQPEYSSESSSTQNEPFVFSSRSALTTPSVFFPFQRRWRRLHRGPPRRKTRWTGTGSPTSRRNPRRREVSCTQTSWFDSGVRLSVGPRHAV